jgi:hypothetical protein
MLNVLEGIHHVRDKAKEACQTTYDASPDTTTVSTLASEYCAKAKVLTGLCFLCDSLCSSLCETRRSGNQRAPHPFRGLVSPSYFEIAAADLASAVGPFVEGKLAADLAVDLAADLAAEGTLVAD